MRFVVLLICLAALSPAFAAPPKKVKTVIPPDVPKKFVGQELVWVKTQLSPEYLQEQVLAVAQKFLNQKDSPFPELRFAIAKLKEFDKYYFFEADTEFSRRWLKSNIAYAEALLKAKGRMNYLILNKQTQGEEYRKWYDYYTSTAKGYWAVSRKPVKVADKKRLGQLIRIKKAVLARIQAEEAAANENKPKLQEKKK